MNEKVLIPCDSIYGPMMLVFKVDPTPGKRLRRILGVDVVCPILDATGTLVKSGERLFEGQLRPSEVNGAFSDFNGAIDEITRLTTKD